MIDYKGGNGSSKEEAIIILGANNETEGVDAEYDLLEEKFGEQNNFWRLSLQELLDDGDRQYDKLSIEFKSGNIREFWFDITDFYGK